jgi:hypothetical protein
LISSGSVTTPIIVRLVINAATTVTDAPRSRSDADKGNARSAGTWRTPPTIATSTAPSGPDWAPRNCSSISGETNANRTPMRRIITTTIGSIPIVILIAIFTARPVRARS